MKNYLALIFFTTLILSILETTAARAENTIVIGNGVSGDIGDGELATNTSIFSSFVCLTGLSV